MNYTVLGFIVATITMYVVAFAVSPDSVRQGLKTSYDTFVDPDIGLIPLIITATLIAGLVQATIPREVIANFFGEEAGLKGMALGSLYEAWCPGVPTQSSHCWETLSGWSGRRNDNSVCDRLVPLSPWLEPPWKLHS